jgi:hypothetical protein
MEVAMKPLLYAGALVMAAGSFVVAAAPAGEASQEALLKDMLGTLEKITKELSTIQNQGTADAARPELKKAATKMLDLRKQADEVKQPSKEEKDRLAKEYAPKFEAAVKKLQTESARVKGVPGGEAALEELAVLKDTKDKGKKDPK